MTTHAGHQRGRDALELWAASQPEDFFAADTHFHSVLPLYARPEALDNLQAELHRFGREASQHVDALVRENNLHINLPRLERFSPLGTRVEAIVHHPSYHEVGRYIYGSGVMAAYADGPNQVGALARFHLSCFNGEAGHNCPLACTAGVIRVLQELGSDDLKQKHLPGLLNPDYAHHLEGAQFLTEVQGGSDVGQNATVATQAEDGSWRITGEKWFCSNIDADLFLMTARVIDASGHSVEGTRGLGLFLVERNLADGSVNSFHVRRLKDKLGTRSMASGECDFEGAVAHHMGEVGDGFKHMMTHVINVSRLYNAVGAGGLARRAWLDARRYAEHRQAFGQPIIRFALIQETLATMRAQVDAMTSGSMRLAMMQDALDRGELEAQDAGFMRLAVNLNKLMTAKMAREVIVDAIEVFGGNGAIETTSILPRLLRDCVVFENWEGTHNTLLAQGMRDMQRYKAHVPFLATVRGLIEAGDASQRDALLAIHARLSARLDRVLSAPSEASMLPWRDLAEQLICLYYASARAWELAQLGPDDSALSRASLAQLIATRLSADDRHDAPDYSDRIALLATAP